jgi:hypothetical protein
MYHNFNTRIFHEINLLQDIAINLELIDTITSTTIYTNSCNENNNLHLLFNKNIEFDKCKIEIKLLESSLFYNNDTNLIMSFIFSKEYPFTCSKIIYNNFLDSINLSKQILTNIKREMKNENYYINETEDNNEKYYIYYKLNSFIKKYTDNWRIGDQLKNFVNNFLNTIYDFENEIKKIEDKCNESIYTEDIPLHLIDNVFTSTIYNDPVIAEDGFTYEREAITKWFVSNNRSPTTGKLLNLFILYPNNDMRSRCLEWKELHTIKLEV